MNKPNVFEFTQNTNIELTLEFYYMGNKIEDPKNYFEANPTIFDFFFPLPTEILAKICNNLRFKDTHKLVISEYGFHLIQL